MRLIRIELVVIVLSIMFSAHLGQSAEDKIDATWVDISSPIVQKLTDAGQKTAWPGETAGVAVDPASGDVYMIVTGQGVWKSTDTGKSFARVDGGKVGGRCETSFALNVDSGGKRLACFMLDGKCAWSGDSGQTWNAFTDVGRNWDYAAVDWSADAVKTIFAALHESGGQVMFSSDGGKTWNKLFKDAEFDKSGGLGIFDERTLVYTQKGKGIQRSTDAGQTWTKIADREPIGRLVTHSQRQSLLAREGGLTGQCRQRRHLERSGQSGRGVDWPVLRSQERQANRRCRCQRHLSDRRWRGELGSS